MELPQGLKPGSFQSLCGTTEVVPCYKAPARCAWNAREGQPQMFRLRFAALNMTGAFAVVGGLPGNRESRVQQ